MAALKSLSWSAFASIMGAALDVGKIIVLTRYLSPQDFGLFAIVLVVIGFCQLFSEGGVGNALVSKKDISADQAGYILNFNIVISLVICAVALGLTPLVADFYQAPDLLLLIPFIVIVIPFSAVAGIFQAMLLRDLKIQLIAKVSVLNKFVGLLVAWWAAEMSLGIYALAWSVLIATFVTFFLFWRYASVYISYKPSIKWRYIQPILSFSIYQLGEFLLNFFAKNFDVLLITKLLGSEVSGLYVVTKNLLVKAGDIIVMTFSRYFHPLLAKIQNDFEQLTICYLSFFKGVSFCVVLAYVLIALNHDFIINLLLGEAYVDAKYLVPIMSIWLTLRYCTAPVATLWLVRQKPYIGLMWNVLVAIMVPLLVYLFHTNGLYNILLALTLGQVFFLILSIITSYLLLSRSFNLVYQMVFWLISSVLLSAPLYWLIQFSNMDQWAFLFTSIVLSSVCFSIAWKKRSVFLGSN